MTVLSGACTGVRFADRLAAFGERPAVVAGSRALTYDDLAARVRDRQVVLGDVRRLVLLEAANTVECLVTYLAALAGRHPVILTPPGGAGQEALTGRYDPDVVARQSEHGLSFEERRPGTRHDLHPDLALLLSTSGSTGSPKLVRLSATNVQSNAESIADYLGIRPSDRAITSLPMSYCYGLSVLHSHLVRGACLVLSEHSVVDACFWDQVREHGVTTLAGVPYTFDLLDRVGFTDLDLPSLRYVTQAGGRLAPDRVVRFAELGRRRGWDLVVMYGQTEATARMAYLPPSSALTRPDAVGLPVPGGRFRIEPVDDAGRDVGGGEQSGVGEVVYEGPNVMLGYAEQASDLALGRTVTELRTGDLGRIASDGLLEITGRRSAFLKIVGTRVDLDRVDRLLEELGMRACSTGEDGRLDVAVEGCEYPRMVRGLLATDLRLPASAISVTPVEAIPRLGTGKPDRRATHALLTTLEPTAQRLGAMTGSPSRACASEAVEAVPGVAQRAAADLASPAAPAAAGARDRSPAAGAPSAGGSPPPAGSLDALVDLFADVLDRPDVTPEATFVSLGGDSLSFVSLSVRLEEELGVLPDCWHLLPIRELAARRRVHRPAWATVETGVALRAAAIVAVVATHAGLFTLRGGAHLLLAVAGYNFARFTLAREPLGGTRRIARSIARIAVPSALWIAAVALLTGDYRPSTALLLNNALGPDRWGPDWHFWYVEALVWILAGAAVLMAVPQVGAWQRRAPFAFAVALLAIGLLPRFDLVEVFTGPERGTPQYVFWLFALGWAAAAAAGRPWRRALVSAVAVLTTPGFFDDPARDAVVLLGVLALLWVPSLRLPRRSARVAALLASASLYIYLTQWQVYPALDRVPVVAVLASLVVGVAGWYGATWAQRSATTVGRALRSGAGSAKESTAHTRARADRGTFATPGVVEAPRSTSDERPTAEPVVTEPRVDHPPRSRRPKPTTAPTTARTTSATSPP